MCVCVLTGWTAPRQKWTEAKLNFLQERFGALGRPATFSEVRAAQRVMPCLKDRSLAQIKTRAWALSQKRGNA